MKKIALILIIISLSYCIIYAQQEEEKNNFRRWEIGIYQTLGTFSELNYRFSFITGIRTDYLITNRIFIQTGVDYFRYKKSY